MNQICYKAPEFQSMFLQRVRFRRKKFPFKKSSFDSFYSFKSATFCIFVVSQKKALFWIKNISRCQFLNWNFFTVSDFELKIFTKFRSLIQNFFEVSDFEIKSFQVWGFELKTFQRAGFWRGKGIQKRSFHSVYSITLANFALFVLFQKKHDFETKCLQRVSFLKKYFNLSYFEIFNFQRVRFWKKTFTLCQKLPWKLF